MITTIITVVRYGRPSRGQTADRADKLCDECVCVCGLALDTSITLLNNTFCYFGLAEDNSVKVCEIEHREGDWLTDFLWEIR